MIKNIIIYALDIFAVGFITTCFFAVIWDRIPDRNKHIVENIYDVIIIGIIIAAIIVGIIILPQGAT